MKQYNDLFAGGIAASAPVHSQWEYPEWYNPIMRYGPSDCISRLVGIIDKIDEVIDSGDEDAIQAVKEVFGLGAVSDIRDFAQAISYPRKLFAFHDNMDCRKVTNKSQSVAPSTTPTQPGKN